jgi:hypothetical protein
MASLFDFYEGASEAMDTKLLGHRQPVSDENLVHREFYNSHNHTIFWVRDTTRDQYVASSGISLGEKVITVKSKEWCHLPHFYFIPTCEKKCPMLEGVFNFGDVIGRGNKLPSLPIVDAKWQKRGR